MLSNRPLLQRVADPANLLAASRRCASRGGSVARLGPSDLERLSHEIITERYVPEPMRKISIPKSSGKPGLREISIASSRDKIVQTAVKQIIEPIIDRRFEDCSFAYRKGHSAQMAVRKIEDLLHESANEWVVLADIDNFFDSLNHERLLRELRAAIEEESIVRLLDLWIRMGTIDWHRGWNNVWSGVRQGGVLSPLMGNLYLDEFDKLLVREGYNLVRYADDIAAVCRSRREAERCLKKIESFLREDLNLRLNENPLPVRHRSARFEFLGIEFDNGSLGVSADRLDALGFKLRGLQEFENRDSLAERLFEYNEIASGWRRYYTNLVSPKSVAAIAETFRGGLTSMISSAIVKKLIRDRKTAHSLVEHTERIVPTAVESGQKFVADIVRRAFMDASLTKATNKAVTHAVKRRRQEHLRIVGRTSNLVVSEPGTFLGKNAGSVVIKRERRKTREVRFSDLDCITLPSHGVSLSSDLITHCARNGIPLLVSGATGNVNALLTAPRFPDGDVGLNQIRAIDRVTPAIELAKEFIRGKISNQQNVIKSFGKYHSRTMPTLTNAIAEFDVKIKDLVKSLRSIVPDGDLSSQREKILGLEGTAARRYWELFSLMIPQEIEFPGRIRHGATDLVNSLLNYGYAVLSSRVELAILKSGLLPNVGFLHAAQPGKPVLAFDLIEEFRAAVVDRSVITILNRHEPAELEDGGLLTIDARKRLVDRVTDRLSTVIAFRGRELTIGEIIQFQANAIVRHLDGRKRYRAFVERW